MLDSWHRQVRAEADGRIAQDEKTGIEKHAISRYPGMEGDRLKQSAPADHKGLATGSRAGSIDRGGGVLPAQR